MVSSVYYLIYGWPAATLTRLLPRGTPYLLLVPVSALALHVSGPSPRLSPCFLRDSSRCPHIPCNPAELAGVNEPPEYAAKQAPPHCASLQDGGGDEPAGAHDGETAREGKIPPCTCLGCRESILPRSVDWNGRPLALTNPRGYGGTYGFKPLLAGVQIEPLGRTYASTYLGGENPFISWCSVQW